MDTEKLNFKIGLSGTGSATSCTFQILVNDTVYIEEQTKPETTVYEFDCDIQEGEHCLKIKLLDKDNIKVVKDSEGNLIEDFLLNIDSVEIDDIDIGALKWTHSSYFPEYPENYIDQQQKAISEVKNCVTMGWNGVWQIAFTSPFYVWLLENL